MKKLILRTLAAAAAFCLASCIQHEMTITLNKDGSGTIVEETTMGNEALAMLEQMAAGFGGEEAGGGPLDEMLDEEAAKKRAAELGEGVRFVSVEPLETADGKGARVTFAFEDINKLTPDLGSGMNNMPGMDEEEEEPTINPIGFKYDDGILTVTMPRPEKEEGAGAAGDVEMPNDPESEAMMKQIFGSMKMRMKLTFPGGISETNAAHRDGNDIILMEMDFGQIVANPDGFKKLAATGEMEDPAAVMEALKDVDGVKLEVQPEFTVTLD